MKNLTLEGACLAILALAAMSSGGCYDPNALNQFLQEPRSPVAGVDYRVYPPDTVSIDGQDIPEINGKTSRVRPDGKINLPLLGEIFVAGKTPAEIEETLAEAGRKYYERVDHVTVTITNYASQRYYVMGQVASAGPMPWTGRDTLLDALARAQPTSLAWPERIIVTRAVGPQVGGNPDPNGDSGYKGSGVRKSVAKQGRKMVVNLNAMVEEGDLSNNVLLMPNDVVYVQPNPLAAVGLALQNLLFPIRPATQAAATPASVLGAAAIP